ncbi:SDR family NAD(P)-dependent oxidoreductase [Rhodococcoides yunnanense]|uniref:SDR family NAD(P)-dependent oxidoreductase n=1 Tax=Rhodococcoides yunnanense TaxID=278209 RepID=A0ABU4BKJ9_9NOCA|nr:SDR family NAD(P)-dependent oxidoreductase [Rhodococcus yunnanensis]MDV6264596.1 SDR family NAD(P)-dependent oxidoreductase [Rhodococcus yunnanensis]
MSKVWFITGTSKGFGRAFVRSALERGDRVAATARNTDSLSDFVDRYGEQILTLPLDVTDRDAAFAAVSNAHDKFGRLDVVVNNAGYALNGMFEELTPDQLRAQYETNVLGVLNVTQAALPIMREQRSGHILQTSSYGGLVAYPALGAYNSSKWALEALTDSLSQEVAQFGIKVTLIEPAAFATDFYSGSASYAEPIPAYDEFRSVLAEGYAAMALPEAVGFGSAILKLVDAENPPLRVFFGEFATQYVPTVYKERLDTWRDWHALALEAEGK